MIIKKVKTGIFFKLDGPDWDADWKGFLAQIKKLKSVSYNCPDVPDHEDEPNWWFVGNTDYKSFIELKKFYINKQLADQRADADAGFKPISRRSEFAKRGLKF